MMENLGILLGYGGVPGIIIIILVVALMAAVVIIRTTKGRVPKYEHKKETQRDNGETKAQSQDHTTAGEGFTESGGTEKKVSILGTGNFKCLCYRPGKIMDFTSIPYPIGDSYVFDTSLPISGIGYQVKELPDGTIVDYDPREVPIKTDETPAHAWHAVNWLDDVKAFWTVPVQWWKSSSNWYAAGMMLIVFISGLAVMG